MSKRNSNVEKKIKKVEIENSVMVPGEHSKCFCLGCYQIVDKYYILGKQKLKDRINNSK